MASKAFNGSYLRPYPRYLLNQFPYDYYIPKIFSHNDVVIDSKGNLIQGYKDLGSSIRIITNCHKSVGGSK